MRVPVDSGGGLPEITLQIRLEKEDYPDDVETIRVGEMHSQRRQNPDDATTVPFDTVPDDTPVEKDCADHEGGEQGVEEANTDNTDNMEGTLSSVNFPQYEVLYEKWKRNNLSDAEVVTIGGRNLLDLMQAQYILDTETITWEPGEPGENVEDKKGGKRKFDDIG